MPGRAGLPGDSLLPGMGPASFYRPIGWIMISAESREEVTARIKETADIVQIIGECIELKRSGTRYLGLCPFHGEKTPSFSVHSGQQFFHCFGCGESGDVFSFVMKYHNLDFPGAVKSRL